MTLTCSSVPKMRSSQASLRHIIDDKRYFAYPFCKLFYLLGLILWFIIWYLTCIRNNNLFRMQYKQHKTEIQFFFLSFAFSPARRIFNIIKREIADKTSKLKLLLIYRSIMTSIVAQKASFSIIENIILVN